MKFEKAYISVVELNVCDVVVTSGECENSTLPEI